MIPITVVRFGQEEEQRVLSVLRSGGVAQGPVVREFEDAFAELSGARHAIAVNNGTTALIAALEVLDLQPGDEVVTTPFTFVATINAILRSGARAVLADIREEDFNLDPDAVAPLVGERTRVLAPVHLYGQMADMAPLADLAGRHGLRILEDAAQSHGAQYRGHPVGHFGDLATYSFYATKNITTGEGGVITTEDDALADRLRVLRNQGMRERYVYEFPGDNYRLTDLQAALAMPQLKRYPDTVQRRQANAARLSEGLAGSGLVVPRTLPGRTHVWHQYSVLVPEELGMTRDEVVRALNEAGVGAGVYYPRLIGDYDAYREHPGVVAGDTPVARRIAGSVFSLPVHQHLSPGEVDRIVETVLTVVGGTR